jgi:hypothetical protein
VYRVNSNKFSARVFLSLLVVILVLTLIVLLINATFILTLFSSINTSLPSYEPTSPAVIPTTAPALTVTPGGAEAAEALPAVPETRRLTLEYPLKIKAGAGSDVIRLTLEVDSLGNITPTANIDGNVVEGEVIEFPNLYDTHNVTAEAQFDIAGLEVKPAGITYQPLKPGEKLDFYWSISAQNVGTYRGTIWLYLNFESRSSGEKSRIPVSAQVVEIEAVDLFGFSVNFVRTSGVVGSVLGIIVGFPFFEDIVKSIWGRLFKKKKQTKPARKT